MKSYAHHILILGCGPMAAALSSILGAKQVRRMADDSGWAWPTANKRSFEKIEGIRLVLAAGPYAGVSKWIRWHRDARECPLARRVGCMLFGMSPSFAAELNRRDVFGRLGCVCASFREWGTDLVMVDNSRALSELVRRLDELETLPESSWRRDFRAASCLTPLIDAIKNRSMADMATCLEDAHATDWDATCFSGTHFGNSHAWANSIRGWLAGVTAGVTPDWEEGFLLLSPLSTRQSTT